MKLKEILRLESQSKALSSLVAGIRRKEGWSRNKFKKLMIVRFKGGA